MNDSRRLRVFLCHASQNKPAARELYQQLSLEGWIDPWLDEEKLLPGQDWDLEIEKAVEVSEAVIVCLSSRSVTKEGYVQKELRKVLDIALEKPEEAIFVIPVRLDDCELPRRLRSWHYVDFFPGSQRARAYQRLLQSLRLRMGNSLSQPGTTEDMQPLESRFVENDVDKRTPSNVHRPEHLTVSVPSNPSGILDLGWSILPIILFALLALYSFGYNDSDFSLILGITALLTGSVLAFRRQITESRVVKFSTLIFIVTHSLFIYSEYAGWDASDLLAVLDGLAAVIAGGVRVMNYKTPRKAAPYTSIFFGAFLALYGLKLIVNFFDIYTSEIQTPIIVLGIIAAIILWFEQ